MIHLDQFLASKRSEKTRERYQCILDRYAAFCETNRMPILKADTVVSYRTLLVETGLASGTVDNHMACLKSYFAFLEELDIKPIVKLKGRIPKPNPEGKVPIEGLSDSEVQRILEAIDSTSEHGKMHAALIHTMLFTGIRISEAANLKVSDLKTDGKVHTIQVCGKGSKYRTIPLQDGVKNRINDYLNTRASIREEPLFTSTEIPGKKLHNNSIRWILKKYCDIAGITKKISPHSLRVTCVSNALEQGANPIYVQYLGGWSTMEMVLRYDRRRGELKNSAAYAVNYGVKK